MGWNPILGAFLPRIQFFWKKNLQIQHDPDLDKVLTDDEGMKELSKYLCTEK